MLGSQFETSKTTQSSHHFQSVNQTTSSIDLDKFLEQTAIEFEKYQSDISNLQASLLTQNLPPQQLNINQAHFWLKRSTNDKQVEINIEAQYLQDSVFNNLDFIHQQDMERIFVEAKTEINRLTDILIERDKEISALKEQSQKILTDSLARTRDSDKNRREYETLVQENRDLDKRVKELLGELSVAKSNSNQDATRKVEEERRSSNGVVRINSNRSSINQPSSTVLSSRLKEKTSRQIQTDDCFSSNLNAQGLQAELQNRLRQIDHLNQTLYTFNQEFQTLKNDNFLFAQDVSKNRIRTDQLQKIIKIQNQHIDSLRNDALVEDAKHKQIVEKMKQDLNKQRSININNTVSDNRLSSSSRNSNPPLPVPQSSNNPNSIIDSKVTSELKSEISKLKIQIHNLQSSNRSLTSKIQLLASQNNKLSNEITHTKSQNVGLNSELINAKAQHANMTHEINRIKCENQSLISEKNQLQSQVRTMITHQPNTEVLRKNNEQLSNTIKSLQSRILLLGKAEQENGEMREEVRKMNQRIASKEREWGIQKSKYEQQISQSKLLLSRVNSQKQRRLTDNADAIKENQMLQERVQILRNQMILKNNIIDGLDRKIKEQQKILQIYKNQFNSKNKGLIGFGTSNSLTEKSPERPLPQIESPEELIAVAKDLLSRGAKADNSNDLYNVLMLMTEEFEMMRNEWANGHGMGLFVNGEPYSSHHSSRSQHQQRQIPKNVYQQEINSYITSLLNKISEHEVQLDHYEEQINKLHYELDNAHTHGQDDRNWEQLLSELQFERKLTEKLSDYVKSLKDEIFNLNEDLEEKNQEIYELSSKMYIEKHNLRQIDIHLGDVQNEYQRLLNSDQAKKIQGEPGSEAVKDLLDEIQAYRIELQKAVNLNQQLKQCLDDTSRQCKSCYEYQILVEDLQARLENYQKLMMGELKKIFTSCEKEIQRKERITLQDRIENLKQKTSSARTNQREFEIYRAESPPKVTKKKYIHTIARVDDNRRRTLETLIQTQKLSLETMLILMLKLLEQADNQALYQENDPILPEHVRISNFDKTNPQNMIVEIAQNRNGAGSKARGYLAPERLKGAQPTRKSLMWNLGLLFHYIINKKAYFTKETQIMDSNHPYRYQNKVFPELRMLMEGILEKDAGRRKILSHIKNTLINQLTRSKIMRARG